MSNLVELKELVVKHGRLFGIAFFAGSILAAGGSLMMKNVYTADAKLLAPSSPGASLGGLLAGLAMDAGSGLKNLNDLYLGLVRSRVVIDKVIADRKLQEAWGAANEDDIRDRLNSALKATAGKDGIIRLEVTQNDPKEAAALANGIGEALLAATASVGVTEASARRKFFEQQMGQVTTELEAAEKELRAVQVKTGIMHLQADLQTDMATAIGLESRIAVQEGQLASMRQYSTEQNPNVVQAKAELVALKSRLDHLRKPDQSQLGEGGLAFVQAYRLAKGQEAKLEIVAKLFEQAKMDEARTYAPLQWVDKAVVPVNKSGPKRSLITAFGGVLALLIALLYVVVGLPARSRP